MPGPLTSAGVPPIGPEDHVRGEGEGLIVYADLGCAHCAAAWTEIAAGANAVAFRHFPVASKHPRSPALHAAAEAAGAQGMFFEMVDSLYGDRAGAARLRVGNTRGSYRHPGHVPLAPHLANIVRDREPRVLKLLATIRVAEGIDLDEHV